MAKLITPIVYENKLAGLSDSFPLTLQAESRAVIDLPLADLQPADDKGSAVGKFLQCDNQGVLLRSGRDKDYKNIETFNVALLGMITELTVSFSQKVYGVNINYYSAPWAGFIIHWGTLAGPHYASIGFRETKFWPFVGTDIVLSVDDLTYSHCCYVSGFY